MAVGEFFDVEMAAGEFFDVKMAADEVYSMTGWSMIPKSVLYRKSCMNKGIMCFSEVMFPKWTRVMSRFSNK